MIFDKSQIGVFRTLSNIEVRAFSLFSLSDFKILNEKLNPCFLLNSMRNSICYISPFLKGHLLSSPFFFWNLPFWDHPDLNVRSLWILQVDHTSYKLDVKILAASNETRCEHIKWKMPQYGVFFWSVFFCIPTEYSKIRTRKNSVFGHFSHSSVALR